MKKILKSIAVLMAAAAALTACQNELPGDSDESGKLSFSIGEVVIEEDCGEAAEGPETRTHFTTPSGTSYPVLWSGNEVVKGMIETNVSSAQRDWSVTASSDKKTAKLTSNIVISTAYGSYDFYMVSPKSAYVSRQSKTVFTTKVPDTQTPRTDSPDESAQVLVGKSQHYTSFPTQTVHFSPKHMTAYIKLTLTGTSSLGTLQSVTVTSTKPIAGNASYDFGTMTATATGTGTSVTANTSRTSDIWFACLPAQVAGTKLTITAVGSAKTLTREITVPSGKNLTAGKVAILSVEMNPTVHVTGVTLNKTSATMYVGTPVTLTATVTPSNAADKSVTWSSSNTTVATVSSSGVVTPKKEGTTTITVTTNDGGKTATCEVTVYKVVSFISLLTTQDGVEPLYDDGELHLTPTKSASLQYKVTYSDGTTSTNSGAKVEIRSGSGVSLSGRTLSCTSVGQTATVRVTALDPSSGAGTGHYKELTVRTWSDPTSVTYAINTPAKGMKWVLSQELYTLQAIVNPSTARQKVNIDVPSDKTFWEVTRVNGKTFSIKDKYQHTFSSADQLQRTLTTTFTVSVWQNPNVKSSLILCPTTIDISKPKLLDYVAYNPTSKTYRILDGGLRVLLKTTYDSSDYKVKDLYYENVPLNVPSGYQIVGIVTIGFDGSETDYPTTTGLVNPNELVTYGADVGGTTGARLPLGKIHGFAISMYNAVASNWCNENDDVDNNANWSRELTNAYNGQSILSGGTEYNRMNGFNLTICAHQYNVWRGSSHSILPANMVWNYGEPGYELNCYAFPKTNPGLTFVMRPWFVPTIWNWNHIAAEDGSLFNSPAINAINRQIGIAGGNYVFPYSTDSYWTINVVTQNKNQAYVVYSQGSAPRAKSNSAGVRPFLIF